MTRWRARALGHEKEEVGEDCEQRERGACREREDFGQAERAAAARAAEAVEARAQGGAPDGRSRPRCRVLPQDLSRPPAPEVLGPRAAGASEPTAFAPSPRRLTRCK